MGALVLALALSLGDGGDGGQASPVSATASTQPTKTPQAPAPSDPTSPTGSPSASSSLGPVPSSTSEIPEGPAASGAAPTRRPSTGSSPTPSRLETVPVESLVELDPVDVDESAEFGTGLVVRVVQMEAVAGEAKLPGEVAGPAVRVELEATNDSDEAISLATSQVEMSYGADRAPGMALSGPGGRPFPASLAPGEKATGSFVFGIPLAARDQVQILVFYSTDAPLVAFEGKAPLR